MSVYAIFNDQRFNDMLTNDIVSFEQLGSGHSSYFKGGNLPLPSINFAYASNVMRGIGKSRK